MWLLSLVGRFNELGLGDFDLRYIRNQQGEEVDFLMIKNNNPFALFEAKKAKKLFLKQDIIFQNS